MGAVVANNVLVTKLSAIPLAIFAMVLAVAGTTTATSVLSAKWICWTLLASSSSNVSVCTLFFVNT